MSEEDNLDQFEILAMIHQNKNTLKNLVFIQFLIICSLILGLIYVSKRPPLLIRIDKLGNTDVLNNYAKETNEASEEDVKHFTKKFLDDYVALKSNLVVRQFETSLNMMTDELAKQHLNAMKEQNTIGIVQAASIRNDLEIKEMKLEKIADEFYITAKAILSTRPLDDLAAIPKEKPLIANLVLQKVKRSGNYPFALLAKGVQIQLDQKGKQAKDNLGELLNDEVN